MKYFVRSICLFFCLSVSAEEYDSFSRLLLSVDASVEKVIEKNPEQAGYKIYVEQHGKALLTSWAYVKSFCNNNQLSEELERFLVFCEKMAKKRVLFRHNMADIRLKADCFYEDIRCLYYLPDYQVAEFFQRLPFVFSDEYAVPYTYLGKIYDVLVRQVIKTVLSNKALIAFLITTGLGAYWWYYRESECILDKLGLRLEKDYDYVINVEEVHLQEEGDSTSCSVFAAIHCAEKVRNERFTPDEVLEIRRQACTIERHCRVRLLCEGELAASRAQFKDLFGSLPSDSELTYIVESVCRKLSIGKKTAESELHRLFLEEVNSVRDGGTKPDGIDQAGVERAENGSAFVGRLEERLVNTVLEKCDTTTTKMDKLSLDSFHDGSFIHQLILRIPALNNVLVNQETGRLRVPILSIDKATIPYILVPSPVDPFLQALFDRQSADEPLSAIALVNTNHWVFFHQTAGANGKSGCLFLYDSKKYFGEYRDVQSLVRYLAENPPSKVQGI